MKMFYRIIFLWFYLSHAHGEPTLRLASPEPQEDCLTGYMTDVQSWVKADGVLNPDFVDPKNTIDLSHMINPVAILHQRLFSMRTVNDYVKYLSMAQCGLQRIPLIFQLRDYRNRYMSETLEYMTFYGNQFVSISSPGKEYDVFLNATGASATTVSNSNNRQEIPLVWSSGLEQAIFPRLKELDLRACSIRILNPGLFRGMPNLEALYIGENKIYQINNGAFMGLQNLRHLDFSRNHPVAENDTPTTLVTESLYVLENITTLVSLDLSHTKLSPMSSGMIRGLGPKLKSLSMCNTGLLNLINGIFEKTSLEILDISRNNGMAGLPNALRGLEKSLAVLYAKDIGLQTLDIIKGFRKLEILRLSNNEIASVNRNTVKTLKSLQILDLNNNRLGNWFNMTFSLMPNLRLLSVKENNINVITVYMIKDLMQIDYVALTGNSLICNCHAKDLYKMAAINEEKFDDTRIKSVRTHLFHKGFEYYNGLIQKRNPLLFECDDDDEINDSGRFRFLVNLEDSFTCLNLSVPIGSGSQSIEIASIPSCSLSAKILDLEDDLSAGKNILLTLLVIPCLLVTLLVIFLFRRNLRYCFITMRNTAMLSLINKNEVIEDATIFNYDVFVSYCNEDRGWVLDHLLPHMEAECSVSACLHERDFQVGLSILENIVSCMDRSRLIMLIISQRFLLSQWCQFEMHLAQHRLLETRREDLILVLLEDIPRRLRPNTLHYLMVTKTYIVWPKNKSDRAIFWRRMKKSLLSQRTKLTDNVSLA